MENVASESRQAVRILLRSKGFAATVIAVLALGIGASTAIFSVVNRVLLEPLPYPEPGRLVQLRSESPAGNQNAATIPQYTVWRDSTRAFQSMAAYDPRARSVRLMQGDWSEPLRASRVSADYFLLFGAAVVTGRTFTAKEDSPGGPKAAVIGNGLWRRRFGANPAVVGEMISLENEPYKVVGVLATGTAVDGEADIWLPLQADPSDEDHVSRVRVVARVKAGVTFQDAADQVARTIQEFARKYPGAPMLYREHFALLPLRDAMVGDVKPALIVLLGAVGLVLLISCANAANLLLARATRRGREFAIRAALGARRKQLIRQLLAESLLLALPAGVLGLGFGYLGVKALLAMSPADLPRIGADGSGIALDWRVFLFTLAVSLITGILFGLAPALHASRTDVSTLVKDSSSQSGMGFRKEAGRSALVITEMALAVVLLAGAGLLIQTFVAMRTVHRGFDEENVLTVRMPLHGPHFAKTQQVVQLVKTVRERMRQVEGVSMVAATSALPLETSLTMPVTIERHDQSMVGRYHGIADWRSVSPEYFETFRIRLLRGRLFQDEDNERSERVVVINRLMMKRYWPEVNANPIGEFISIGRGMSPGGEDAPRQIIGIVADIADAGLGKEPMMYIPLAQVGDAMNARNNRQGPIHWVIRTEGGPQQSRAYLERELQAASGGLPLERGRTMREVVAASSGRTRFYVMLLSVFAGIALSLAGVGLYGLLAYSVQQRTREIGIRMAIGAGQQEVQSLVVWQGMRLALLGILIGVPGALAVSRVMGSMIFGMESWDPVVFGAAALALAGVALFAAYIPSLRATRVDPMEALRS